jgi:DNA-binding MarR family transcriptional regulator
VEVGVAATADELDEAFFRLFQLRGVLDPADAVPGLGASVSEIMALSYLRGGQATQFDLGNYLGLEKSTVSRLVDNLAAKGWVEKSRDPSNRRFAAARLTAAGRRATRDVGQAMHRRHRAMLDSLSARDASTMIRGLNILLNALEREAAKAIADAV